MIKSASKCVYSSAIPSSFLIDVSILSIVILLYG
jgi:hypothetical protein